MADRAAFLSIGRYTLGPTIAAGGTSTVHIGWVKGDAGFSRPVAIKRLHPQFAKDSEFEKMFLDEARLASRIRHLHVIPIIDVVKVDSELLLVMEYVRGVSLAHLLQKAQSLPVEIAASIASATLNGLHAAHTARDDQGTPLSIIHRDVSPQNIFIGSDGAVRILDFGIAKAVGRLQTTREGEIKGKYAYMAPEQLRGHEIDARVDLYAAGVVLWEMLAGRKLFAGDSPNQIMMRVLEQKVEAIGSLRNDIPQALDALVKKAIARAPANRFANASEMQRALESAAHFATLDEMRNFVETIASDRLAQLDAIENARTADAAGPEVPRPAPLADMNDTVRDEPSESPKHEKPRWLLGLLGLFVVAAIAIGVGVSMRHNDPSPPAPPASVATTGAPPAAPETTTTLPPEVTDVPPAAPVASATVEISHAPRKAPIASPPILRTKKSDCDPPFKIDSNGVKIPKAHCF